MLSGCGECHSHFFYFIKKEYYEIMKQASQKASENVIRELNKDVIEIQERIREIDKLDKVRMEKDVREIIGVSEQEEIPVILDLESIRVIGPGKFELDVVNLFNKKRPLIYKLEEGKYIIDLASTLRLNTEDLKKIKAETKFSKK